MKKIFCVILVIFTCILLVGCNSRNKKNYYDEKLEFYVGEGKTIVFYYDKDKLTAYQEYYEYKDEDEAKQSLEITENELNDPNVVNIFREKNYVVLGYSDQYIEEEFGKYTKKEIIEMYSVYEKNLE